MSSFSTLSDTALLELIKDGNRLAYTAIYERYNKVLFIHAFKRLQDGDKSVDICHDVFMNLWEKRDKIEIAKSLRGYLLTSVRNKIFNLIAHEKIQSVYIEQFQSDLNKGIINVADHDIRYKQLQNIIEKEINDLPPKMRMVFRLSRDEQLSYREIANELNISEETVKDQIKKALKILRGRLAVLFVFLFV